VGLHRPDAPRGLLEAFSDDLQSRIGHRIAYGGAARLAKMARFGHGRGRDLAAGVVGFADDIEEGVLRRLGHGIHAEPMRPAVRDVMEEVLSL